jgi:hypothetical protein
MMIELEMPIADQAADDLNDKGEVLVGNGIWAGGVWTPKDAPPVTGTIPGSTSENHPEGAEYQVIYNSWRFFNNDRKLLQAGSIYWSWGDSGLEGGARCPVFWPAAQSSPSLFYDTADLWDGAFISAAAVGVSRSGEMVVAASYREWPDSEDPEGSTETIVKLFRFGSSGASAGSMDGSDGYRPLIGGWRHSEITGSGWVASNLVPVTGSGGASAHRLGLWTPGNGNIALPAEAQHWGYPVSVTDLPNEKVVLVGGKTVGAAYTGRVFLPDATGQYRYVPGLSGHQIERFGGDGTAITKDHKLWRNGKLIPLRELCPRYGELLDEGFNLFALKSNKHGVYLIVGEDANGTVKNLLLQPLRFQLRHEDPDNFSKGWDDTGAQPWASVGVGKTNSIVLLNLAGLDPALAGLLEIVPAAGSEGFVSLQNQTITEQVTRFDINGIAATPTPAGCRIVVREKANHGNISNPLNVHVLPPRTVNFAVYHAWDDNNQKSKFTKVLPTLAEITEELNTTFTAQTNITFNLCRPEIQEFKNCSDVIAADGKVYALKRPGRTENDTVILTKKASEAAVADGGPGMHLRLFVVKGVVKPNHVGIVGLAEYEDSWGIMAEDAPIRVYSHEAGHALGLTAIRDADNEPHEKNGVVVGPNRVDKPLMARTSTGSRWLRHQDWFKANSQAGTNRYGK